MAVYPSLNHNSIASLFFHPIKAQQLRGNPQLQGADNTATQNSARKLTSCPTSAICTPATNAGAAYKPPSNTSSIAADGDMTDWTPSSCGIPMWEAGNSDKNSAVHSSNAFINWDCDTGTLCILVKATGDLSLVDSFWFKNYDESSNEQVPIGIGSPTNVYDDNNVLIGWEGCYKMNAFCINEVEIHANFAEETGQARTTSTGKPNGSGYISLDLTCSCDDAADCMPLLSDGNVRNLCYEASTCEPPESVLSADLVVTGAPGLICDYDIMYEGCCTENQDCDEGEHCASGQSGPTCFPTNVPHQVFPTLPPTSPAAPTAPTVGDSDTPKPTSVPTSAPTFECTSNDDCNGKSIGDYDIGCAEPSCNMETRTCQPTYHTNEGSVCDSSNPFLEDNSNACQLASICEKGYCQPKYNEAGHECHDTNEVEDTNFPCYVKKCIDGNTVQYGGRNTTRLTCVTENMGVTQLCEEPKLGECVLKSMKAISQSFILRPDLFFNRSL